MLMLEAESSHLEATPRPPTTLEGGGFGRWRIITWSNLYANMCTSHTSLCAFIYLKKVDQRDSLDSIMKI